MKGLIVEIESLYFSTFRKPTSTSLMLSYSIPPFTTIRGLFSNSLGLARDDLSLQNILNIGIAIKCFGNKNQELAKILKLKEMPGTRTVQYPSGPMFKEFLVNPEFIIYIGGEDSVIDNLYNHLKEPIRPLYIGQSDDLVEVNANEPIDIELTESDELNSAVEGIIPGAIIEKIPYKFEKLEKGYKLEYKILSLSKNSILKSTKNIKCYKFNNENVYLV